MSRKNAAETPRVRVRVLPAGDGRVATGKYDATTNRFTTYSRGEVILLDADVARAQERNGLLEIVGE
jgi:hypothetical protein